MNFVFDLPAFENNIAIINEYGEHFYYSDLINICNQFASVLHGKDKKLVIILTQNNIETIIGYLAAVQSNNSAMLIDASLDKELLDNLIKIYNPDFVWGPPKNDDEKIFKYRDYELIQYDGAGKSALHPALSVLLSTSGSTGSPKLVRLTKDNVFANAKSIAAYLNLNETERPITNLPMHYSYGLSIINSHLLVGATILLTDKPIVKKEFWDFFKLAAGTSLAGVPYTYEMLKRIGFFTMDLPSLRYMTQAGGKMDPQLILEYAEFSRKKNFVFYVMYGATEATARISYLSPEFNMTKAGSIGKAIPNGTMQLMDESGAIVTQPNIEGELVYQGPNVMMGYAYCREDLVKDDELFGSLRTGDLAYFDEEKFFYVTGRKSRFLKILGKRIGLSEIEKHLQLLEINCICGGEDDLLLIAFYQKEVLACQEEEFNKIRKEVFLKFNIPLNLMRVFQINKIPRNTSGKINYGEIFSNKLNKMRGECNVGKFKGEKAV